MRDLLTSFCIASLLSTATACVEPGADPAADPAALGEPSAAAHLRRPLPAASRADLAQALASVVDGGAAPGAMLTVDHPAHRRFETAAGVASLATGQPMEPAHRIRAGSMLKTALATAVLQLVERGKLSLDARLAQLLPASLASRVPEAGRITLRMLLSHTAGVPEFAGPALREAVFADPDRVWTVGEYLALSAAQPRPFPPGAGWSYSNTHYVLLGEIVSAWSGAPWRETVKRRVLERAGLRQSSLPRPGDPACRGCARGYELLEGGLADLTEVDPSMAEGSGGGALVTTTGDLARFLRALLAGDLFDRPGTLALMKSFVSAPIPQEAQTHYGLGLARIQFAGMDLLGHYGSTAGYSGFMLADSATGLVVSGAITEGGNLGALIIPVMEAAARLPR